MATAVRGEWRELWALPGYRRVMWSRIISNIGNGITPIALAFGVLDIKGANGKSLSLVTGAHSVAVIIFMLAGGVVADRFGRLRVVGLSDIVGSLIAGSSAVLLITGYATVPLLAVNGFVMGFLNAVWLPAYRGIIPQLVPAHLLKSANALNGVFANVFMVTGAATAGVIVSVVGAGWGVLVDAVSFFVAGILVFSLRRFDSNDVAPEDRESPFAQMRGGWREFSSRGWLVGGALASALYHFAFEGFIAVAGPVQAKQRWGGPRAWGLSMAGWGVGGLLGVIGTTRLHPRHPLRAGWMFLVANSLWMFSVAAVLPVPVVFLGAVLGGATGDFNFFTALTTMQLNVPDESLARVGSYTELGMVLFMPLGLAVAGPMVDAFGPTFVCTAAGIFAFFACMVPLMFPSLRNMEAPPLPVRAG